MKVSLKWLNDLVNLADLSTAELDDLLTFAGVEVEGIVSIPQGVIAARITASEAHPNAGKLSVCQVDDGSHTTKQIVCGAKNYKVGDIVPLATPGTSFPGGFEIAERKMRGELSQGMLCSAAELGISTDSGGLLILPPDSIPGTPLTKLYPPVFDLEVTPNRPDLLSHRGMARELAALTNRPLNLPDSPEDATQAAGLAEIRITAPFHCPFYSARRITGVKVAPSPPWLKEKLEAIGLRPINNIVDITNYILMETGQPLHAFDAAKVNGGIVVRLAADGETFQALDGREYALTPEDVVIADQESALALGGVMGGDTSGVTESTTDIILESAYFTPPMIRRTARHHNLSSDSSYRFERGVDPQGVLPASTLAARLIIDLAGGTPEGAILNAGELPSLTGDVDLDEDRARTLLGAEIASEEMQRILTNLGLQKIAASAGNLSTWRIPSYRIDLQRHIDLVEEIARVYGLEKIPATTTAAFAPASDDDIAYDRLTELRARLSGLGFFEIKTIKLVSQGAIEDCPDNTPDDLVHVKNPLSDDHTVLRPSLLPGLLAVAARNIRQGAASLRFYEIGTVFRAPESEEQHLGILLGGDALPSTWHHARLRPVDFFDLRGILESILPGKSIALIPTHSDAFVLAASVCIDGQDAGLVGQLHPKRARALDSTTPLLVTELNAFLLTGFLARAGACKELDRFPAVTRDIAMEIPAQVPNAEIESFFSACREPLLESTHLFDVFADPSGERLPADKKSLAYSLTYRDKNKTLTASEVDDAHGRILAALKQDLPVQIR